jgi:hypothetical protein
MIGIRSSVAISSRRKRTGSDGFSASPHDRVHQGADQDAQPAFGHAHPLACQNDVDTHAADEIIRVEAFARQRGGQAGVFEEMRMALRGRDHARQLPLFLVIDPVARCADEIEVRILHRPDPFSEVFLGRIEQPPDLAQIGRPDSAAKQREPRNHGPVTVWCRSFDHVMCSKGDESWAQAERMNFARMRFGSR